jgi:hypothetical protein
MTHPLQIYIDAGELRQLEAWTRRRGWTKSQAVRVAIRALTRERGRDPLLDASGMIEGLPSDLSTDFDKHLEETFVVRKTTAPRRAKQARPRVRR